MDDKLETPDGELQHKNVPTVAGSTPEEEVTKIISVDKELLMKALTMPGSLVTYQTLFEEIYQSMKKCANEYNKNIPLAVDNYLKGSEFPSFASIAEFCKIFRSRLNGKYTDVSETLEDILREDFPNFQYVATEEYISELTKITVDLNGQLESI